MNGETMLAQLGELGQTSKEVGDSLILLGVKGKRRSARYCVIAEYLRGRGWDPVASTDQIDAYEGAIKLTDISRLVVISTPRVVARFMVQFDAGMYPELDGEKGR